MPCYEMFLGPLEIDLSFNNLLKACILFLLSCFGDITGVADSDQDPIANKNPDPDTTVIINMFPALKKRNRIKKIPLQIGRIQFLRCY